MSLMVAVDFTGSNGSPMVPGTLHYLDNIGRPNEYQAAMRSIGSILQPYDSDAMFPLWGFGARINKKVEHCFQLGPQEEVYGVDGLLDTYRNVFASGITMSGPTLFSSILNNARNKSIQLAQQTPGGQAYSVLLILTDGIINDMRQTIDLLVSCSDVPLSVIIVGVGTADFTAMETLDGDDGFLIDSRGRRATRDVVQFVPFSKYANSPSRLAAETLMEVPTQAVQYFLSKNILPRPPPPAPNYATAPVAPSHEENVGGIGGDPQYQHPVAATAVPVPNDSKQPYNVY